MYVRQRTSPIIVIRPISRT